MLIGVFELYTGPESAQDCGTWIVSRENHIEPEAQLHGVEIESRVKVIADKYDVRSLRLHCVSGMHCIIVA